MSHNRNLADISPAVLAELNQLYTERETLRKQNNDIVSDSLRERLSKGMLFAAKPDTVATQKLGNIPERLQEIDTAIRVLEDKYHLEVTLDSPAAAGLYMQKP